jgi:adenylate kinase
MKFIFVAGSQESGKDEIMDMILGGYKKMLPAFRYIKFDSIMTKPPAMERDMSRIKAFCRNFRTKLEKALVQELKKGGNLIVNGFFTIKTEQGYVPLLPDDFFEAFRPDLLILIEVLPSRPETYMMQTEHMDWLQQEINRDYMSLYSAKSGAMLKVVNVRLGNIKGALKETADVIRFAMK